MAEQLSGIVQKVVSELDMYGERLDDDDYRYVLEELRDEIDDRLELLPDE